MLNVEKIKPGLEVRVRQEEEMRNTSGVKVATVDHLDGENYIKLKRNDSPDGQHHWIPCDWVESVDDGAVLLSKTEDEFWNGLLDESPVKNAV